jgi:hypothetical protein
MAMLYRVSFKSCPVKFVVNCILDYKNRFTGSKDMIKIKKFGNFLRVKCYNTQKNVYNTQKLLPECSFLEIF